MTRSTTDSGKTRPYLKGSLSTHPLVDLDLTGGATLKYTTEIVIDQPRQQVIDLLTNPNMFQAWQPGLEKVELLEGKPGQPGRKNAPGLPARNQREIDMIEMVDSCSLPNKYTVRYETEGVKNRVVNRFDELEGGRTRWMAENEFKFSGWMIFLAVFLVRLSANKLWMI